MSITTLVIYAIMYIYGFSLMLWTIFWDKRPTRLSRNAGITGLLALLVTLAYTIYTLWTVGITR